MHRSLSLKADPSRIFRHAILNGVAAPPAVIAKLESLGINVSELEARLRQNMEFTR